MSDDALINANDREIFEAIVSELVDPELQRLHRIFLVLSASLFVLGTVAVTVVGSLGWPGFCSFSATFVTGLFVARRVYVRRFSVLQLPT